MNERKLFDISVPLEAGMIVWPGDPVYERVLSESMENGSSCNVSRVSMSSHAGTHVDAPAHFIRGGLTVEVMSLDVLIGEALVLEFDVEEKIVAGDLKTIDLKGVTRVLFKAGGSQLYPAGEFVKLYPYLTEDAANYLVQNGVRLVGMDYLSIDKFGSDDAHRVLLDKDVVILETIDLTGIDPGLYELICLPLKMVGSDGAPARAILRTL